MKKGTGKNSILVVEDEKYMRDVLESRFVRDGYQIYTAGNGQEGLKLAIKYQPNIILLDILTPKMDGIQMMRELRRDEWGKQANIILLTNIGDGPKLDEAMSLGAIAYMLKAEWSLDDIAKKIKQVLAS